MADDSCTHLDRIEDITPSANGCEDCLRIGADGCTSGSV